MENKGQWCSFGDVVSMLAKSIGSDLIAWDAMEARLTEGKSRAKADFNTLHELTQRILRTEERLLKSSWWQVPGRFGRFQGLLVLYTDVDSASANGWQGFERVFAPSNSSHANVMLWMPDVVREYPGLDLRQDEASDRSGGEKATGSSSPRRRGPTPIVRERVRAAMRMLPAAELRAMKLEVMVEQFGASKDTCSKGRDQVLSEFSGD